MDESLKRSQSADSLYERDPYSWALAQARALRQHQAGELDWDNLAEELTDLARRDAHALQSNCELLIAHLLKLAHAPDSIRRRNQRLWRLHARNTRRRIADLLAENPGLRSRTDELFARAWPYGRDQALIELRCDDAALPNACPWKFEQACQVEL